MGNICQQCGKTFLKARPNQKYCSIKCRRKAQHTRWRKKYPNKMNEYHKRNYKKLRAKILNLFGSECSSCGESDLIVLALDHKIPIGKNRIPTYNLYAKILRYKDDKEYLSHFQLLCRNCNWRKMIINNEREILKNGIERPEPISYDVQARSYTLCDWMEEI